METEDTPEEKPDKEAAKSLTRKARKPKRKSYPRMPEVLWQELRALYETGTYSQKALVDWATAKGFHITQPAISMRVVRESWVKGDVRSRIAEDIRKDLEGDIVDNVRQMLESHAKQGQVGQLEVMRHFRQAADIRKVDPDYNIPAAQIATLLQALKMAEDMEARARGWSYKEGKPFKLDDKEGDENVPELTVRVLSEAEEQEMRDKAEEEISGENESLE